MKKMLCLMLCLALLPIFAISASAADKQLTYGSHSVSGEILTDFTDGQIIGSASSSGGGTMSIDGGVLTMETGSASYVESYTYYKGGNIGSANVKNAKYICFEIENPSKGDILFNFQGTRQGGRKFRTSHVVAEDDELSLLLVTTDGKVYRAAMEASNARLAVKLPAGFKGTLVIPTSCVSDATANDPDWDKGGNLPFESLGFYIFDKGEGSGKGTVKVGTMFIITDELPSVTIKDYPQKPDNSISNPEYSYTDDERIQAYWTDKIMHNECITFVQDKDGSITAHTLFVPKRIISIIDNSHKIEFEAGVDFQWTEGTNEIKWLNGSAIPYFFDGALKGLKEEGGTEYVKNWDGSFDETGRCRMGGWLYCVGKFLFEKQLSITYEYDTEQAKEVEHAKYQPQSFKNVARKIKDGEELNIVFFGASNFEGYDASGMYNRAPNMPVLHKLVENYLNDNGIPAKVKNIGVGGWNTAQGLAALKGQKDYTLNGVTKPLKKGNGASVGQSHKRAIESGVDLFVVGYFAGNNIGSGVTADNYYKLLKETVELVRSNNPDCEFVILSGSINNNITVAQSDAYREKTKQLADEFDHCMGYADLVQVYKDMMARKEYISLSGNNINHPNDFFIRVTAMEILSCFVEGYSGESEQVETTDGPTAEPGATDEPSATDGPSANKPEGGEDLPWAVVGISGGVIIAAIAVLAVFLKRNGKK